MAKEKESFVGFGIGLRFCPSNQRMRSKAHSSPLAETKFHKGFLYPQEPTMIDECIGCREVKEIKERNMCSNCVEWEKKHLEEINSASYLQGSIQARNKKETIPADIRWAVWERDNFTCRHCGSRQNLSVDHIIPESRGGQLTMENTQTLCKSCNSSKGAK